MVTPAPLTTVPITSTNRNLKTLNNFKRKSDENIGLAIAKKTTETNMSNPVQTNIDLEKNNNQTKPTFRIPKISRPNDTETAETKINCSPTQQSNDESNSQQGKRKFSLSQYKEHKRLKSNDSPTNYSGDVDMRIAPNEPIKNTPASKSPDASPKTNDNSKELVLRSNLSEPGVKKVNKKKLVWADEKNRALVHISIFEIDDSEKADMHAFARQCAANISLAQIEKLMERDLRKRQGLQDTNERMNLPALPRLIRILLPDTIVIPKVNSQEHFAQEEREKTVLQAFSFRSFLPDCPGEPDCDLNGNSNLNEPKLIPSDDVNAKTTRNEVSSEESTPTTTTDTLTTTAAAAVASTPVVSSGLSSLSLENLSPEVAKIFAQAQVNLTTTTATNSSSTTTVNTSISQTTPVTSTNSVLPSLSNLSSSSNYLSTLLNLTRSNGIDPATSMKIDALLDKIQLNPLAAPPANPIINPVPALPLNFNLPAANPLIINQLLAQTFALGMLSPTPFNNPVFPPPINSNSSPSPHFSSPSVGAHQPARFNNNDNHHHHHPTHTRGNNHRGRGFRRGGHNNMNRRDYYPNRNHNNRNMFT